LDIVTDITGTGLDSSLTRPTNSHPPVLVQKNTRRTTTYNPKTNIVVVVVEVVVVAISRTAIFRIVVPRTTAQQLR
jgi:hypothetical protein